MKDTLGGKGAGLAEMSRAGLPVPPGFTIATDVCNIYFKNNNQVPDEIQKEIDAAIAKLEKQMGQKLGDAANPLLLSVRSGAKFSMPGMMNTILNLGLNDETTAGLAAKSGNERFAYDCYRRFIQMFGEVALENRMEKFDHIFDARKAKVKAKLDTDLNAEDLKAIIARLQKARPERDRQAVPGGSARAAFACRATRCSAAGGLPRPKYYRKMEKIPDDIGTAANVQAMVFGNMGDTSGTGVGFTRDPGSGEKVFYGEFLMNAQGEDVVAGIRTPHRLPTSKTVLPEAFAQLSEITTNLEKHYKDMQDFEFTIQEGKLYMLQTRNGKRTGPAAVRIAVAMVEEGMIIEEGSGAARRSCPARSVAASGVRSEDAEGPGEGHDRYLRIARRRGGPRCIHRGRCRRMAAKGPVLLVRKETTPDDIHGMDVAKGILTAIGGKSSHAAVVARGMGRPCVVGAGGIRIDEAKEDLDRAGGRQDHHGERRRFHFARRHHRRRLSRPGEIHRAESQATITSASSWAGPMSSAASSACAPMRISRAMPTSPASSAPRASGSAAPSICSSPKIVCPSCRR